MKNHIHLASLACAALSTLLTATTSATVLSPAAVDDTNANSFNNAAYVADNLINGPFAATLGDAPGNTNNWVSNGSGTDYFAGGPDPVFIFDMGADTDLGTVYLWAYSNGVNPASGGDSQGNSVKDFRVRFATAADGPTGFGTSITLNAAFVADQALPTDGGGTPQPQNVQVFPLSQVVNARYVEVTLEDNYFGEPDNAGGDRVGFNEIAFDTAIFVLDPLIDLPDKITVTSNGAPEIIQVTVTNSGANLNLEVTDARISGPDANGFSILTDFTSPLVIGPGLSADIDIETIPQGLPAAPIPIEALLEIDSNDVLTATSTVPIDGILRDPWIDTVASIDLDPILPGAGVQTFTIEVNNLGTANDLTVEDGYFFTGPDFAVDDDLFNNPLVISAGSTGVVNLSFDSAGVAGVFTDTLQLVSDDPAEPTRSVSVTITVVRDPEISAPALVIGPTIPLGGSSQSFTVQVDNLGPTEELILSEADVFVDDAVNFTVDSFETDPIPVGGNGLINITFDPQDATGVLTTVLEIVSNDPGVIGTTNVQLVAVAEPHAAPTPLPGGLMAWWSMDSEATPGNDDSGNGFDGSAIGAPTSTTGANANTGSALDFSGTTHIDVPWSSYLNPGSFTVTLWANPTSTGGYASPITSRDDQGGGTPTYGYVLYNDNGGNWTFWTGDGDPGWHNTTNGGSVAINTWTHLAISYDAGTETKSIFVNGVLADSATVPPNLYVPNGSQGEDLHLAAGQDAGDGFYFQGALDDVAVFNTALSVADINTIMNQGVSGFLNSSPATPMQIVINGYDTGTGDLSVTVNNIPSGEAFHLEKSINLQDFEILSPAFNFDENTVWPQIIPTTDPLLFLQAYDGPSVLP